MLTMDYTFGASPRIKTLYNIAKEKAWNANKDLPWPALGDAVSSPPYAAGASPFSGFDPYENLTDDEKIRADRKFHVLETSEILHGEQGALRIAAQLIELLPTMEAKLFAGSQVFDEARHVEFFSRYLLDCMGEISPPSPELARLIEGALEDTRVDMKLITMQIVIESLAMAKFQRLRTASTSAVLQIGLDLILKDEARHVNFGTEVLHERFKDLPAAARDSLSDQVFEMVLKLANNLNLAATIAEQFGWDKASLRRHLRSKRVSDPGESRAIFRQLQINLNAIGLLTDELKRKLDLRGLLDG